MIVSDNKERYLTIEEVAVLIGVSCKTINNWYWYKRTNPNNEITNLLPNYVQERPTSARYWKQSELGKFTEFQSHIVRGRNGFMGSITQKYYHDKKEEEG